MFPKESSGIIDMLFLCTFKFILKICALFCIHVILQLNLLKARNFAEKFYKHLTVRKQSKQLGNSVYSNILAAYTWKLY